MGLKLQVGGEASRPCTWHDRVMQRVNWVCHGDIACETVHYMHALFIFLAREIPIFRVSLLNVSYALTQHPTGVKSRPIPGVCRPTYLFPTSSPQLTSKSS